MKLFWGGGFREQFSWSFLELIIFAVIAGSEKSYELCCDTVLVAKEKRGKIKFEDLVKKNFLSESENRRVKREKIVDRVKLIECRLILIQERRERRETTRLRERLTEKWC